MALSDKQVDRLIIGASVVGVLAAILGVALLALLLVSYHAPNPDPTMTVCRPQYGNCTEATR